ncbi:MAG: rRNA pseudouridine synthase [Candidatus Gracilibacteria bacterium]|nr:rRNA pseudouridine synthase [Candidatus Gracilibacteria bacterium]
MRIDKFISNLGYASRKEIIKFIKDGYIGVNGEIIYQKEYKIKYGDIINIGEENVEYKEFIYIILNKKSGYVSSTKAEGIHKSYKELIQDCSYSEIINIVGRLDFDTTGLLFLTNNGDLTHKIIHPKKDIFKKYRVTSKNHLTQKDIQKLENGVKIDDFITKPSKVEIINENEFYLSISEGKFHQIKKMLEAINNEVTSLHRVSIGDLELGDLESGKWRYLGDNEVKKLLEIL